MAQLVYDNNLSNPDTRFISSRGEVIWWQHQPFVHHFCKFASERFNNREFADLDIEFPSHLEKAVVSRKSEYLAGRYLAKLALEQLGSKNRVVSIGTNRQPIWPPAVIGSISHSGNYATAIATADARIAGLGVDVENKIDRELSKEIEKQILDLTEIQLLDAQVEIRELLFTIIFSVKESFFKALFPLVNTYFGFEAVRILSIDTSKKTVRIVVTQEITKIIKLDRVFEAYYFDDCEGRVMTLFVLPTEGRGDPPKFPTC